MSPNLDEAATTRDMWFVEHLNRSRFLAAVARAAEFEGLPAPKMIGFEPGIVRMVMDQGATDDVDDWAALLGVTATDRPLMGPDHIRSTGDDMPEWHGYRVYVWCIR